MSVIAVLAAATTSEIISFKLSPHDFSGHRFARMATLAFTNATRTESDTLCWFRRNASRAFSTVAGTFIRIEE